MTNSPYEKAVMAGVALELAPPLIRESLLNDKSFKEEYGLKTQAMIAFGKSGVTVPCSGLFDAVRIVLAEAGSAELTDAEGRTWSVTIDTCGGKPSNFVSAPSSTALSPQFESGNLRFV